jgi:hypothetical protein
LVEPENGHAAIKEIRIVPGESGEIPIASLRDLTRSRVLESLGVRRRRKKPWAELHGRRSSKREDLLVLAAVTYQEAVGSGSTTPSLDVYEFLVGLRADERSEGWAFPGKEVVGRDYSRSAVRTLIKDAKARGYMEPGSALATLRGDRPTDDDRLLDASAQAALRLATRRKAMYAQES